MQGMRPPGNFKESSHSTSTSKGSLTQSNPNMKERECDHQATSKGNLAQHQQAYMKERSSHAGNVTTKQLQLLTQHQRVTHEGKNYPCRECDHRAASNGNLTRHQQAIHKGKKFPCMESDYQATSKGSLNQHQQAIHE